MSENNLIIFLKYPEPHKVKTRLGNVIGYDKAAKVYSSIVRHLVSGLSRSEHYKFTVCFTPEEKLEDIKSWVNNYGIEFFCQRGDTLGERISNAFESSFSSGFENTIIIGSDCIEIDKEYIENTFKLLSKPERDVVLGPTKDGGYYLIGQHKVNNIEIFRGISWSTETVFTQTVERLKSLNLEYLVLDYFNDIDEISDLDSKVIEIINRFEPELRITI